MIKAVRDYLALHRGHPRIDLTIDDVEGEAKYGVSLVDFPNCIAQGPTLQLAFERLKQLAPSYLERMVQAGVDMPMAIPSVSIMAQGQQKLPEVEDPETSERFFQLPRGDSSDLIEMKVAH